MCFVVLFRSDDLDQKKFFRLAMFYTVQTSGDVDIPYFEDALNQKKKEFTQKTGPKLKWNVIIQPTNQVTNLTNLVVNIHPESEVFLPIISTALIAYVCFSVYCSWLSPLEAYTHWGYNKMQRQQNDKKESRVNAEQPPLVSTNQSARNTCRNATVLWNHR